ncbi:hypothetical protein Q31b_37090 [Novipirellula aureliae]|uniref:Uncharacterized protein n=1 Tax=Novipirellula aureliae TaxID=2527966 RepID=A0A5C6DUJ5_9BACT|nr:hypothetical protein [Novipirellula aureliae]TWU40360.1 hypothetical protein Q31b_37090 [Novipirellula aureliae]
MNEAERYWKLSADPFSPDVENWFFVGSPQRAALAQFGLRVPKKPPVISLVASPANGTTTLLKHLSLFRGVGNTATQFAFLGKREVAILHDRVIQQEGVLSNLKSLANRGVHSIWMSDCYHACLLRLMQKLKNVSALTFLIAMSPDDFLRSEMHLGTLPPKIELQPMPLDDTRQFILQSMRRVDGDASIFAESAIERLHRVTGGRIGEIACLANRALTLAAQEHSLKITAHTIEYLTRFYKRRSA